MQPKRTLTICLHTGLASLLLAALAGCEAAEHTAIDAGAAGGGAAIGYAVDKKNPYGAAIGGGAGLLVGEAANYGISSQKKAQYLEGYNKGRSDEVKTLYWAQRAAHQPTEEDGQLRRKLVEIPVDEHRTPDGTLIEEHTRVVEVVE